MWNCKKVVKGPSVDAAFVEINESRFYPTNVTQWTKTTLFSSIIPYSSLTGKTVTAEGNATRKAITGKVTTTDLQYTISCNSVVGTLNYNIRRGVSATYTNQSTILKKVIADVLFTIVAKKYVVYFLQHLSTRLLLI